MSSSSSVERVSSWLPSASRSSPVASWLSSSTSRFYLTLLAIGLACYLLVPRKRKELRRGLHPKPSQAAAKNPRRPERAHSTAVPLRIASPRPTPPPSLHRYDSFDRTRPDPYSPYPRSSAPSPMAESGLHPSPVRRPTLPAQRSYSNLHQSYTAPQLYQPSPQPAATRLSQPDHRGSKRAHDVQDEQSDAASAASSDKRRKAQPKSHAKRRPDPMDLDDPPRSDRVKHSRPRSPSPAPSTSPQKRTRRTSPIHQGQKRRQESSSSADSSIASGDDQDLSSSETMASARQSTTKGRKKRKTTQDLAKGKRGIQDVDQASDGSSSSADNDDRSQADDEPTRNADSDVDTDEDALQQQKPTSDKKRRKRSRSASKRLRSTSRRTGSEDLDVMDGQMRHDGASSPPPHRPSTSTSVRKGKGHKSVSSTTSAARRKGKASLPPQGIRQAKGDHKAGTEWINPEGERCKADEQGVVRRLCEVKEWRKKYRMPKDSKHPDRDAIHEVVVEKWLTNDEFEAALKDRRFAWQHPVNEPGNKETEDEAMVVEGDSQLVADQSLDFDSSMEILAPKQRGIYHTIGSGTPLRTYSRLSLSSRDPPSRSTSQPGSPGLLKGRLRIPSSTSLTGSPTASPRPSLGGRGGGSATRSWSSTRASKLFESEQHAKEERDRRRRASVRLGGEEDPEEVRRIEEERRRVEAEAQRAREEEELRKQKVLEEKLEAERRAAAERERVERAKAEEAERKRKAAEEKERARVAAEEVKKASEAAKAAAAAAPVPQPPTTNLFAPPGPSSSATESPAPPTNLFAPKPDALVTPDSSTAKAPGFSFGTPSSVAVSASTPTAPFSFGTPAANPVAAAPSTLSFGATAAQPPKTDDKSAAGSKAPFSFGNPSVPATTSDSTKPPAPTGFSFGASAPAAAGESKPNALPSFGFGTAPGASSTPSGTPPATAIGQPPTFSFGAAPKPAVPAPAPALGGFSFDASAAPATPTSAPPPSAAPTFGGFGPSGNTASAALSASTTSGSPFSFGAAPTASQSPFGVSAPPALATPSGGFSFGASQASTTAPGQAAPFSFGTPGAAAPNPFGVPPTGGDGTAGSAPRRRPTRRLPGSAR